MTDLEKFYKKTFLTPNIVDRCIHCHKHNTVQVIVQMEMDGRINQGPFCRSCYLDLTGFFKHLKI
jgi:hypothetical protein